MLLRLKELRKERGISQAKLGEAVGTTQQSINKYENHGVEPDISMLKAFADFFDVSIDYLVGRTDVREVAREVREVELDEMEIEFIQSLRKFRNKEKEVRIVREVMESYED